MIIIIIVDVFPVGLEAECVLYIVAVKREGEREGLLVVAINR